MKVSEIEFKIQLAEKEAKYWRDILADKACVNCLHFATGGCDLAGGQVPPPEVQKAGCPAWEWDQIPF